MEAIEQRVSEVIRRRLDGDVDLEVAPDGYVIGHVISGQFDDTDYEQRRRLLWSILREELGPDELERISTLLTYTPEEWNVTL